MLYRVYIDETKRNRGYNECFFESTDIFNLMSYLKAMIEPDDRIWKIEEAEEAKAYSVPKIFR